MPSAWDTMIEFDPQAGNSRRLHDNGDDNNDNNDDNDNNNNNDNNDNNNNNNDNNDDNDIFINLHCEVLARLTNHVARHTGVPV